VTDIPLDAIADDLTELVNVLQQAEIADDFRVDGILQNTFTKLGGNRDVENYNRPRIDCPLSKLDLENLFATDAMCQRVCTLTPDEMKAGEVTLKGVDDAIQKKFTTWMRKNRFKQLCRDATVLAQIYDRGAAVVLDVQDGKPWDQPVNKRTVKGVTPLFVADGYKILPVPTTIAEWEPTYYQFAFNVDQSLDANGVESSVKTAVNQLKTGNLDRIHKDRFLWFPGIWCPPDVEQRFQGSPSRLAIFWRKYCRYEMGLGLAVNLMSRMSIINYQRKGLSTLLNSTDQGSEAKLLREMQLVQNAFHNLGLIMSDMDNHKVEIITRNFAELANLIDRFRQSAIAASDLTEMELFGMTLNGTGLSNDDMRDRMMRASRVKREQENYWLPHFEKVAEYWLLANTKVGNNSDWEIEFASTLMLTPQEEQQLKAEAVGLDVNYVSIGAIDPKVIYFKLKKDPAYEEYIEEFEQWEKDNQPPPVDDGSGAVDPYAEAEAGLDDGMDDGTEEYTGAEM
jgi:phage-related protein (TIGR01555 family)